MSDKHPYMPAMESGDPCGCGRYGSDPIHEDNGEPIETEEVSGVRPHLAGRSGLRARDQAGRIPDSDSALRGRGVAPRGSVRLLGGAAAKRYRGCPCCDPAKSETESAWTIGEREAFAAGVRAMREAAAQECQRTAAHWATFHSVAPEAVLEAARQIRGMPDPEPREGK